MTAVLTTGREQTRASYPDEVETAPATRTWTRALRRPKRALYLSSPIGLGHARRDLAIARELRR